ncbi:hypothetical protein TYRP_005941 [Tyrophagus putrescentiae]|nr:hypothetical protein TYRP_005941 [Tyrophagus putrescentiae]
MFLFRGMLSSLMTAMTASVTTLAGWLIYGVASKETPTTVIIRGGRGDGAFAGMNCVTAHVTTCCAHINFSAIEGKDAAAHLRK